MTAFDTTIAAVLDEIESARAKHGNPVRRHVSAWWGSAPSKSARDQMADVAKRDCQNEELTQDDGASWEAILKEEVYEALAEDDPTARRAELIQVAAMAFCEIEQLDGEIATVEGTWQRFIAGLSATTLEACCKHCHQAVVANHGFSHGKLIHAATDSRWCTPVDERGTLAALDE